jgi:hypothetical protein
VFLLWIGSVPGSPPFDPYAPNFEPADEFHLFHFDVAWFEPLIAQRWEMLERLEFTTASFAHVFYALRPATSSQREGTLGPSPAENR